MQPITMTVVATAAVMVVSLWLLWTPNVEEVFSLQRQVLNSLVVQDEVVAVEVEVLPVISQKPVVTLPGSHSHSHNAVHVLYIATGGEKELKKARTSMASVLSSRSTALHFHLIINTDSQRDYAVNLFTPLANQCTLISMYDVAPLDRFARAFFASNGYHSSHYSAGATTLKLFLHELLHTPRRIIVLDTDTAVMQDVAHLHAIMLEAEQENTDAYLGLACYHYRPEGPHNFVKEFCPPGGCHSKMYCLGGVQTINTHRMRQGNFTNVIDQTIRKTWAKHPGYDSPVAEQDLFNLFLGRDSVPSFMNVLPCEWNCGYAQQHVAPYACDNTQCALLHFNCGVYDKPDTWLSPLWHGFSKLEDTMLQFNCTTRL